MNGIHSIMFANMNVFENWLNRTFLSNISTINRSAERIGTTNRWIYQMGSQRFYVTEGTDESPVVTVEFID